MLKMSTESQISRNEFCFKSQGRICDLEFGIIGRLRSSIFDFCSLPYLSFSSNILEIMEHLKSRNLEPRQWAQDGGS